jgi:hypothetical protein
MWILIICAALVSLATSSVSPYIREITNKTPFFVPGQRTVLASTGVPFSGLEHTEDESEVVGSLISTSRRTTSEPEEFEALPQNDEHDFFEETTERYQAYLDAEDFRLNNEYLENEAGTFSSDLTSMWRSLSPLEKQQVVLGSTIVLLGIYIAIREVM